MEELKIRLIEERDELFLRYNKLRLFLESDRFQKLDEINRHLLESQFKAMDQYLIILNFRIKILTTNLTDVHKELTPDLIPKGCRYAAIDKDGKAYAYKFKPDLDHDLWSPMPFANDSKFIGDKFHSNNWMNSLIKSPDYDEKLTADDIPDGYNYAAVDQNGDATAFVNLPILNEEVGNWNVSGEYRKNYFRFIGEFNASDWKNSLVEKTKNEK